MTNLSFTNENIMGSKLIVLRYPNLNQLDKNTPIMLLSKISGISVKFVYDAAITNEECQNNEGWDGEEQHLYFVDTENRGIILNLWDSHNL